MPVWRLARRADRVLVLRVSTTSSKDLKEAWKELQNTRKKFLSNGYLRSGAEAWWIQFELTRHDRGWNLHLNFLIFHEDISRLRSIQKTALPRWIHSAQRAGATAHPSAQHAELWRTPRKAVAYAVKGLMHQKKNSDRLPSDGHSPGDLLALHVAGDADAADLFKELDTFVSSGVRRRWFDAGGSLRGSSS